jgi:hypothetical protein
MRPLIGIVFVCRESIVDPFQCDALHDNTSTDVQTANLSTEPTHEHYVEFHQLLKESLKSDDLQDRFINKLWQIERYASVDCLSQLIIDR